MPEVVVDRTADLVGARALVTKLLEGTPYTPADPWIAMLALESDQAVSLTHEVEGKPPYRAEELEVPTVKLYRMHLERVLGVAPVSRAGPAAYPSLLAALATLDPGARDIVSLYAQYAATTDGHAAAVAAEQRVRDELIRNGVALPPFADREPETLSRAREASSVAGERADAANTALLAAVDSLGHADLSSPMHDRIARDGLAALSVALRMSLEGQALIPVIAAERARAVQSAERRIFESRGTDAAKELGLQDVGPVSAGLEKSIGKDVVVLDRATKAIATKLGTSRDDTPGFVYRQSIVDQVLGIQFDALRAHVMLDGEVLFYHQIGTNGVDGNYTGRTRRLDYSVSPIVTMGGKLSLAFDWIHIKDAGVLNGSFETDRFYGANGSITNSGSLGKELGLEGVASTVVDVGAGLLGVRTRVKNAKFTTGEVSEIAVDPSTGRDLGRVGHAPLRIAYTQVDVAYDTAFLLPPEVVGTYWIEELLVGFRYMSYQLPRVLYELTDVSPPRAKNQDFRLTHESPAQKVNSHYYMGGATFRFGQGAEHIVSLFGDLGVYGGAGSAGYELPSQPEEPTAIVIDGSGGLGARLRLTPRKNIFRVLIEAQYHGEVVYQTIVTRLRATQTKDGTTYTADRKIDFGGTDVFHGPRIQVVGIF